MAELIATGRVVHFIVGLMLIELGIGTFVWWRARRGVPPLELAATLAAGAALLFALRAALVGSSRQHVAMWLALALMTHVLYLKFRWTTR